MAANVPDQPMKWMSPVSWGVRAASQYYACLFTPGHQGSVMLILRYYSFRYHRPGAMPLQLTLEQSYRLRRELDEAIAAAEKEIRENPKKTILDELIEDTEGPDPAMLEPESE